MSISTVERDRAGRHGSYPRAECGLPLLPLLLLDGREVLVCGPECGNHQTSLPAGDASADSTYLLRADAPCPSIRDMSARTHGPDCSPRPPRLGLPPGTGRGGHPHPSIRKGVQS
jgi:hypothetical protein